MKAKVYYNYRYDRVLSGKEKRGCNLNCVKACS